MAHSVTHAKVSAVPDGADTSVVQPSDWNAAHTVTLDASALLTDLKTVDGSGSGLDADLLDGHDTSYFLDRANHTGSQLAATISDFSTAADARISAAVGVSVQAYDADLATWATVTPSVNGKSLVSATDYAAMRALLDLEAGTDFYSISAADAAFQPKDSDLTTIAGLTATTDNFIVSVASAWASRTPAQVRSTLGLVIGTNVQAWDTDLDSWAAITRASGFDTFVATPSSANLRSLMTDESGTGALLFAGGALGTPASGTLTNCTGLPAVGGLAGSGQPVAGPFHPQQAETPSTLYGVFGTRNGSPHLAFDATTNWNSVFSARLSPLYTGGGLSVRITWRAASATSGDVIWNAYIEADVAQDTDSDGFASAQSTTTTTNGTSGVENVTTIAFTSGAQMDSVLAGEKFRLKIERNAASGSDTMTGNAEVTLVEVRET